MAGRLRAVSSHTFRAGVHRGTNRGRTKKTRTEGKRLNRLASAFLDVANFLLKHPEAVGVQDGDHIGMKERYKAQKLREYLKDFAEASQDVCSYCDGVVVVSQGERVCTREGHVQPAESVRVANVFYRQVMNYGVWDKNLGTDPMETFKIVKAIIHRDHGVNIRSPTDTRRFGDPEDLVLRDLLGSFSWHCTQAGISPAVISQAAKLVRKRHRRYMEEVLAREQKEAMSLALDMKNALLDNDGRAQVSLQRLLGENNNIPLDGRGDPKEEMAREWVGSGGVVLATAKGR